MTLPGRSVRLYVSAVRIRTDLEVERSEHFAFNTDELTFRGIGRAGSVTRAATAFQILTTAAS